VTFGAGEPGTEGGTRTGRGGSGSGGGRGAGVGDREGSTVALAVPGDGGGAAAEYAGYFALLRQRVHESLRYPGAARRRGLTGTVHVDLEIDHRGVIGHVVLASSSSHSLLDDAAVEAVRGVGRVPFPAGLHPRPLRVRLPVVFDLRGDR
jgi:protein TonB